MNPPDVSLLVVQRKIDDSWEWTAYGMQGQKVAHQESVAGIPEAVEEALKWLFAFPEPIPSESDPSAPKKAPRRPKRQTGKK